MPPQTLLIYKNRRDQINQSISGILSRLECLRRRISIIEAYICGYYGHYSTASTIVVTQIDDCNKTQCQLFQDMKNNNGEVILLCDDDLEYWDKRISSAHSQLSEFEKRVSLLESSVQINDSISIPTREEILDDDCHRCLPSDNNLFCYTEDPCDSIC